jgi:hypothetical protein
MEAPVRGRAKERWVESGTRRPRHRSARATREKAKDAPTIGIERGGGSERVELLKRGPYAFDAVGAGGFDEPPGDWRAPSAGEAGRRWREQDRRA